MKQLKVIKLRTSVNKEDLNFPPETITGIMVYNNEQCTGILAVTNENTTRDNKGMFNFNKIRDLVVDRNQIIVKRNGEINEANIDLNKIWFTKHNIISTFVIIRLIMNNVSENNVFIHEVNTLNIKA